MNTHIEGSIDLASKISGKAEAALSGLEAEMNVMGWAPESRAIMWEAVSDLAAIRAKSARSQTTPD